METDYCKELLKKINERPLRDMDDKDLKRIIASLIDSLDYLIGFDELIKEDKHEYIKFQLRGVQRSIRLIDEIICSIV